MTSPNLNQPRIRLNDPFGIEPLTMDMQQFFEFSFWMAEELLDLEAQYQCWTTKASEFKCQSKLLRSEVT